MKKGQSLVEFALLLPILLLILLALFELGLLFQDHMILNDQVRELGRYAAKGHDYHGPDPIDENCSLFDVAQNLGLSDDNSAVRVTYITIGLENDLALVIGRQSAARGLVDQAMFAPVDATEMVQGHQRILECYYEDKCPYPRDVTWAIIDLARWHKTFTPLTKEPVFKISVQAVFRVAHLRLKP